MADNIDKFMADNIDKSKENKEDSEELKKNKQDDLKQKFIKEFIVSGMKKGKDKTEFLNSIFNNEEKIPQDILKSMEVQNLVYKMNGEDINLDAISLSDLKKESINEYSKLLNKKNSLKKVFLSDYNITSDEYNKKFLNKINSLEEKNLDDLLSSDIKRLEFAKKIFDKKVERKNFVDFLNKFNIKERYEKLTEDNQKLFLSFYDENFNLQKKVNQNDILALFESGIFTDEEKQEILSKFAVSIDLKKAEKLGLINSEGIEKIKIGLINEEFGANINDEEKKDLLSKIKSEDISIDFNHELINKDISNYDKILELISVEPIVKSYNDSMKKVIEHGDKIEDFEGKLKEKGKNNFEKGNILILKTVDKKGENSIIHYYEIVDLGNSDGNVKLIDKTDNNRYSKNKSKPASFSQKNIIKLLETEDFSSIDKKITNLKLKEFKCYDDKSFKSKLENTENTEFLETSNEISLFNEDELENKREEIINKRKKELLVEGGKKEEDISDEDLEKYTLDRDDEKLEENFKEIEKLNIEILKGKIDELDSSGKKFGFEKGITFETSGNKDNEKGYFTIIDIDNNGTIKIEDVLGKPQPKLSFEDFFEEWKIRKPKRISKISSMEDIFKEVGFYGDFGDKWGDFELKDNKILKKEGKEGEKIEYDFLVSTKGKQLIKIYSINGDKAQISFGEIEQKTKDEKDQKDGESKTNTIFKTENTTYTVSIGFLDNWIRKNEMIPRSLEEKKDIKETDIEGEKMHNSFLSRFFDRTSIAQLLAGGKIYIESIENYLKEGQDELSARFANSLWLPEELKADLIAREEAAKKKRMEDYIQKLKDVDSGPATNMIKKWLLNKDAPQYQKEAGLMFMMEKYGVLYAKGGLYEYKGKFLWYEALGGKIGDTLFQEIKAEATKGDHIFTEEELVFKLLIKQCRGNGFNGIKRRSRLHKDYKNSRGSGKQEEMKKGKEDGLDISRCSDIVNFTMGELKGGTYANAIGGLEAVVDRGGPMEEMNKIPFIMLFSGVAYSMEQTSRDALRSFPEGGNNRILPLLALIRYNSGIDTATNTILELSKRIEEKGGENYKGIGEWAEKIHKNMKSNSITEKAKIEDCEKFYDKYDKVLTQALYGLNDGDKSEDSYVTNMIYLEKDEYTDEKGKKTSGNMVFKKYYDTMLGHADMFKYNETYMSDAFKYAGLSGLDTFEVMKFGLQVVSGGPYREEKSGPAIVEEMGNQIEFLSKTKTLSNKNKKKIIIKNLQGTLSAFIENSIDSYSRSRQIDPFLNILGIGNILDLSGLEKNKIMNLKEGSKEYNYINKLADNIIFGKKSTNNESENSIDISNILSGEKDEIKDDTNHILNN